MKKLFLLLAMCTFAAAAFAQQSSSQQSLGDVARANRAKKHANSSETKLNDDNMARTATPSASAEPDAKADDKKADDKDADAKDADAKDADGKAADSKEADAKDAKKDTGADAQRQKNEELQKQIDAEAKEVAMLQRELDVAQREARLRASAYYGDAGTMLRDQAKYAEDTRKSQAEIDGKKQAVDAAQQKLADLQEQARKAGMASK
jgi:cell division protein FtsL